MIDDEEEEDDKVCFLTSIAIGCVDTLDQGPAGAGALAETIPSKLFYDIIKLKSMTTMNHCQ